MTSTRPEGVKVVVPTNVAEFHAARWTNTLEGGRTSFDAITWMASQFGWKLGVSSGDPKPFLHIFGRNRKKYTVREGDWVIALGTNGSVRVCSDKQYRQDYREASE